MGRIGRLVGVAVVAGVGLLAVAVRRLARRPRATPHGRAEIVRCPLHGIAYDVELEQCTECAKTRAGAGRPSPLVGHEDRDRHLVEQLARDSAEDQLPEP